MYLEGDIDLLNKPTVAMVGSRVCSDYGIKQAERFAKELSKKGVCIISGLARGIDSIAHFNSYNEEGKTIAVLASGFNNIYPPENKGLANKIIEKGGLLISEYSLDEKVEMSRFPKRNRIVSGLADFVLVIEAKYRSGSTITARLGMKLNKEVGCLPGQIDSKNSCGTNKLIQEGANLIMSPRDILAFLELDEDERKIELEGKYKLVYETIGTIPKNVSEIQNEVNEIQSQSNKIQIADKTIKATNYIENTDQLSIQEINEILFMLEIDGFIQSLPGDNYVLCMKDTF